MVEMVDPYAEITSFRNAFEAKADPAYREGNRSVVQGGLSMFGVRVPDLRRIAREWMRAHKGISWDELVPLVEALWDGDSHEERIMAMELIQAKRSGISQLSWEDIDRWRDKIDNWVLTDMLGSRVLAIWVLAKPEARLGYLQELIEDESVWSRRLALVATCQINRGHTGLTIPDLTLELVDHVKAERDPMITKAVSWALRELTKTHPAAVATYVERERTALAAHAVREVENKLRTGLKSGKQEE
jgi:3-methyladenine DNA glycosylase AlkD